MVTVGGCQLLMSVMFEQHIQNSIALASERLFMYMPFCILGCETICFAMLLRKFWKAMSVFYLHDCRNDLNFPLFRQSRDTRYDVIWTDKKAPQLLARPPKFSCIHADGDDSLVAKSKQLCVAKPKQPMKTRLRACAQKRMTSCIVNHYLLESEQGERYVPVCHYLVQCLSFAGTRVEELAYS